MSPATWDSIIAFGMLYLFIFLVPVGIVAIVYGMLYGATTLLGKLVGKQAAGVAKGIVNAIITGIAVLMMTHPNDKGKR